MTRRTRAFAVLAGALALAASASVEAACLHVATSGTDAEGRGSASAPYRTLQYAVDHASEVGQEIRVAGGLYEESVTNDVTATGKDGLRFVGAWKEDFSARDLRACRTTVRPPSGWVKKVPCFRIYAATNRFDGIDVTGGSAGFYADYKIGSAYDLSVWHHAVASAFLTNSTPSTKRGPTGRGSTPSTASSCATATMSGFAR